MCPRKQRTQLILCQVHMANIGAPPSDLPSAAHPLLGHVVLQLTWKSKSFSHFQNALFLFHLHDFPLLAIMMKTSLMKYFCGKAEHFN